MAREKKRRIASDSQPPSVSGANVAQHTTSPLPSRSQSPDSSSSGSSMDLKPTKTIRVKRVKHITRGNGKEKLRRVTRHRLNYCGPCYCNHHHHRYHRIIDLTAATASLSLKH